MTKIVLPAKKLNANGSVTVMLASPIQFGEETITELTLKTPKVKHIKKLKLKDVSGEDMVALIAAVSGKFEREIDEMSVADFTFCAEVLGDFLDNTATAG